RDVVEHHGGLILEEVYLPLEASDAELANVLRDIGEAQPDVVFSTLVGESARRFYTLYREKGFDPKRIPIASLSMAEEEIRLMGPGAGEGHITAATYFRSLENEANTRFLELWRA